MPDVSTQFTLSGVSTTQVSIGGTSTQVSAGISTFTLSNTVAFLGGSAGSGSGLPSGGNDGDVVTKSGSAAEWQPPSIPWASTTW